MFFFYFSQITEKNTEKNIIHYSDELFNYGLHGFDGKPFHPSNP